MASYQGDAPLEGHRGSTGIFLLLVIPCSSPLSSTSLVSLLTGTGNVPRIKIVRNFEKDSRRSLRKKKGYPRGEDFAKRRRINYMKHLFFSRYLSTRTNGGRKGQWIEIAWKTRREKEETVTKWEEKEESSCSSSFSLLPRKRQKIKIKKIKS